MLKKVLLAVPDECYAQRFAQYFRLSFYAQEWQLVCTTNEDRMRIALVQKFDFIIRDERFRSSATPLPSSVVTATLVHIDAPHLEPGELFIVQPLNTLLFQLFHFYEQHRGISRAPSSREACFVVTIASAIGCCGKTSIALALAGQLAEQGQSVFYLNAELWNSTLSRLDSQRSDELSQLLYAIRVDEQRARQKLHQVRRMSGEHGFEYFAALQHVQERLELSGGQFANLVELLTNSDQRYDYIVIDTDCSFDEVWRAAMLGADAIIWLVQSHPYSRAKNQLVLDEFEALFAEHSEQVSQRMVEAAVASLGERIAMNKLVHQLVQSMISRRQSERMASR